MKPPPLDTIIANALITMLDGNKGWHEIHQSTGLNRAECEQILLARDLAVWKHDKANYGDPFKALHPDHMTTLTGDQLHAECVNAFGETNSGHYSEGDRRLLYFTYLLRKDKLTQYPWPDTFVDDYYK